MDRLDLNAKCSKSGRMEIHQRSLPMLTKPTSAYAGSTSAGFLKTIKEPMSQKLLLPGKLPASSEAGSSVT